MNTAGLKLRNYLSDTARTKSWAMSPDIVSLYGKTVKPEELISTYDEYVNIALQPNENNNIYVRAISSNPEEEKFKTAFTLRAVPSELILWPQVWNKQSIVGPGPIVVEADEDKEVVAADAPFVFRPSNLGGLSYAFIASHDRVTDEHLKGHLRLRDTLPPVPGAIGNWRDYYDFVTTDTRFTYSNVVIADPTAPIISISTRLRMFEDDRSVKSIPVAILAEYAGLASGTKISLSSDDGSINMVPTAVSGSTGDLGLRTSLKPNFDSIITMNIFLKPGSATSLSWVSLQVVAFKTEGGVAGHSIPITTSCLLGAQNVVFDAAATRLARFASPAALELQKYHDVPSTKEVGLLVGSQPAQGWWFRSQLNDVNFYPRNGQASHSPDIQPLGTSPDGSVNTDLGGSNAGVDVSDARHIALQPHAPNYIYLRGNCTLPDYRVEARLFRVPCNVILEPSQYASRWSVMDYTDGNPHWAKREIATGPTSDNFNVIDHAFVDANPEPPSTYGADHYCLVAETRHPTERNPDPNWPHEDTGDFATGDDFNIWVNRTPAVAWRNIGTASLAGGSDRVLPTTLVIEPNQYPPTTVFLLLVQATNGPVTSTWRLTSDGPTVTNPDGKVINIGFETVQLGNSNAVQGVYFTGIPFETGWAGNFYLQWNRNGNAVPNGLKFSISISASFSTVNTLAVHGEDAPEGARKWPFIVFDGHPGLPSGLSTKGHRPLCSPIKHAGLQEEGPYSRHTKLAKKRGKTGSHIRGIPWTKVLKVGADNYDVTA